VDARAELMELAVASGLKVLHTMLEDDRTAVCGPRYQHQVGRAASRAGTVPSEVALGGRKVQIRRPRVRAGGEEVVLPTFHAFADSDPLNRRVVEQMLVGVAARQYGRSLEPIGADIRTRGTSKRAVSRRFVVRTAAQLAAWRSTSLEALDLVALLVDGVHIGEPSIVATLGIDNTGSKHALGLWDGSTENAAVCQSLLADLQSRGLRTDRSLLVIKMSQPFGTVVKFEGGIGIVVPTS
jgi:transposase-like protein